MDLLTTICFTLGLFNVFQLVHNNKCRKTKHLIIVDSPVSLSNELEDFEKIMWVLLFEPRMEAWKTIGDLRENLTFSELSNFADFVIRIALKHISEQRQQGLQVSVLF